MSQSWLTNERRNVVAQLQKDPRAAMLSGSQTDTIEWRTASVPERPIDGTRRLLDWHAEEIRHAAQLASPLDAANRVEKLWQELDRVEGIAEAKMRLLVRRIPPPSPRELPDELRSALDELTKGVDDNLIHPLVVRSACELLSVAPVELLDNRLPTFEPTGDGGLEIAWGGRCQLTWSVGVPKLPWPGVNVRAYARGPSSRGPVRVTAFHQAFALLEHARRHTI